MGSYPAPRVPQPTFHSASTLCVNYDCQRASANAPGSIKDYFRELRDVIRYKIREENMWNMDEKGFTLGTANRAKTIARAGRHPPQAIHDGTHELITVNESVNECCGARLKCWSRWLSSRVLPTIMAGIQRLPRIHLTTFPTVQRGTAQVRLDWNGFGISMQEPHQPFLLSTDFSS